MCDLKETLDLGVCSSVLPLAEALEGLAYNVLLY